MKIKKISLWILSTMLVMVLVGCQSKDTTEPIPVDKTDGKILVVYYSASGNTKEVANILSKTIGADEFELEPVNPYTEDDLNWKEENSRVNKEHDDESLRDIELKKTTVDNWDEYDTIFIGYPIWWGIAGWPVNSFIEENNFEGKTVIPFCTSTSSTLGDSDELLSRQAGNGEWLAGKRFPSSPSKSDVEEWVSKLGF